MYQESIKEMLYSIASAPMEIKEIIQEMSNQSNDNVIESKEFDGAYADDEKE